MLIVTFLNLVIVALIIFAVLWVAGFLLALLVAMCKWTWDLTGETVTTHVLRFLARFFRNLDGLTFRAAMDDETAAWVDAQREKGK